MDIKLDHGKIESQTADALVIGYFEDDKKFPRELLTLDGIVKGAISKSIKQKRLTGKFGVKEIFHAPEKLSSDLIMVIGLGVKKDFTADKLRKAAGEFCRSLRQNKASTIAFQLPDSPLSADETAQSVAEGALLGSYTFRRHISQKPDYKEIKELTLICPVSISNAARKGIKKGQVLAMAANMARDMANEPSNYMTPADIANIAKDIAIKYKMDSTVLDKEEMAALGMNAAISVSQGSCQPPKFIMLSYKGKAENTLDLALVGKGVTFDSGGISIKPAEGMGDMKGDMSGAASVLAAMSAIAQLKPEINVTAVVAAVENMPSGCAYKPGDVVKAMNGKTIEVVNTDAEGRVTLADSLSYANIKLKANNIVDVATLTGACVVALGHVSSAIFTNKQELADRILSAAKKAGELTWQMPMFEEYKEQFKSDVADMKNTGGRPAGSITAAQFLEEFVGDTSWVHMDIAGVDLSEKEQGYIVKGGTGIPVRTLVNLVLDMSQTASRKKTH